MRAFSIPGAVLLVMALAVGCDQGTPTSPDVDALNPQLNVTEAYEVTIFLTRVDVLYTDGSVITDVVPGLPAVYDLLGLQDGLLAGLGIASLPAGLVSEIRLIIDDAWITFDAGEFRLFVPGSKIKFVGEFDTTTTIDLVFIFVDGDQLIVSKKGDIKLRPIFKVFPVL
ncbi:MAG: hypothetical protein JSW46_14770 [Gemmatimonadota bacterium]|nr:MAG: hypothetical protein JSW46_14770 [Gemmatimonadota bacterium]